MPAVVDKLLRSSANPATAKKEYDRGALVRASMVGRKETMQMESRIVSTFVQVFRRISEVKVRVCRVGFVGVETRASQEQDGQGNVMV